MIEERKDIYPINVPFEYYNEDMVLKPQGYQSIINLLTDFHLEETDQGLGQKILGQYAWVIISLSLDIKIPLSKEKMVYAKTWYSGRRGPFFRREYEIKDKDNNTLFVGASYSILLDMTKRTLFRQKELPFEIFKETPIHLTEVIPNLKVDDATIKMMNRDVLNSHIDGLGHVNNIRYTEYIYDALSQQEIKVFKEPIKYSFYFHQEMMKGDHFDILKNDQGLFQIYNQTQKAKAFSFVVNRKVE